MNKIPILLVVVSALSISACSGSNGSTEDGGIAEMSAEDAADEAMAAANAAIEAANALESTGTTVSDKQSSKWSYSHRMDELRNKEVITARVRSENTTDLDFPYGVVGLNIQIRQHPQWGKDVIFQVDKGQILCHYNDCSGMISFDGSPERLSLNESADNDSSVVFARYGQAIINKIRDSEKVIVELPFYQNGNRQFVFETSNLEWPHKE